MEIKGSQNGPDAAVAVKIEALANTGSSDESGPPQNRMGPPRHSGPPRGRGGGGRGHRGGRGGNNNMRDSFDSDRSRSSSVSSSWQGGRDQRGAEERKLQSIIGPTTNLPPLESGEKKFSGRCRLYIGSIPNDMTNAELTTLFEPFGEVSEVFVNGEKMFGFVRLDYRANAEKAKAALDGSMYKNRSIKVRFAPQSAAIKCKNLNPFVTNELLEWGFQVFGEIERAVVITDERGRPTGEGIVEFARKASAQYAVRRCTEDSYFLSETPRPVIVEAYETFDETDGYSEKSASYKGQEFHQERSVGPRFAARDSFEEEYAARWKDLYNLYKTKEDALKNERQLEIEKLESQMNHFKFDRVTELLKKELMQREQEKARKKEELEMLERSHEERRRANEEMLLRKTQELTARLSRQDEEQRIRHEAMRVAQFDHFNNQQEESGQGTLFERRERPGIGGGPGPGQGNGQHGQPIPLMDAMVNPARRGRQGGPPQHGQRWPPNRRNPGDNDQFDAKRRRF